MDHNNYIPAHGYYYPTTPPETQLMMPYNNYTPQQIPHQQITPQQIRSQHVTPQVTPQYEYDSFSFTESVSGSSDERSLSEPFIFKANTPPQAPRMCIPSNAGPHKFPAVPISPINSTPRVKAKRTPTACEECRKKKQKCDGEAPCQSCKEQHTECLYREVPPTKKDNSLEKMIEMMEGFSAQLANLSGRIDAMGIALKHNERRLAMMPHSCWQCGSGLHQQSC